MRKFILSAALASATLIAVPASAAHPHDNGGWDQRDNRHDRDDRDDRRWDRDDRDDRDDRRWDRDDRDRDRDGRHWDRGPSHQARQQLMVRLDRVEQRIVRSERRGMISPREAFGLRRDANQIRQRLYRASRDGLSGREFAQLQQRVNRLEQNLRNERRDRDGRRY